MCASGSHSGYPNKQHVQSLPAACNSLADEGTIFACLSYSPLPQGRRLCDWSRSLVLMCLCQHHRPVPWYAKAMYEVITALVGLVITRPVDAPSFRMTFPLYQFALIWQLPVSLWRPPVFDGTCALRVCKTCHAGSWKRGRAAFVCTDGA